MISTQASAGSTRSRHLRAVGAERAPAARCVARCARLLRPGGLLFVRDYAAGDLAQKRLEAKPNRRTAEEDGFVRGEGTLARYFSRADFDALFDADFEELAVGFVERDITNRKQKVTMERRWIQGKYVRRGAPPLFSVGGARTRRGRACRPAPSIDAAAPPPPPAGSADRAHHRPCAGGCLGCARSTARPRTHATSIVMRDFASDRPAAARAPTDGKVLRAKIFGMGVSLVVAAAARRAFEKCVLDK